MSRKSDIIIERHYADPAAPDFERDQEIVAEALARMLTPKGRQIREYILDHNLPDGGRGYAVMGAWVKEDGHAYEAQPGGPVIDHGQVTEPGPMDRVERARERWYRFGL